LSHFNRTVTASSARAPVQKPLNISKMTKATAR
jgi:hypothetical protein